jgi:UDP-N-acetylglucosamine--N-acetylmuramyl-(pentapeptide) pyrophosphoryl-undecaprenol N-acetylglucosamine transferase
VIPKVNLPGDHQVANARALERSAAASVLYEGVDPDAEEAIESVSGHDLAQAVRSLLGDPERLERMAAAAKTFWDPATLDRICSLLDHLTGNGPAPQLTAPERPPRDRILGLSSNALDHLLRRVVAGSERPLEADEQRLARHKIDGFLASQDFVDRARGCRMVGLAGYEQRLELLVRFATGTRPNRKRYREAPIVRRDAWVGLAALARASGRRVAALAKGLGDAYFEARSAAADAVTHLARRAGTPELFSPLIEPLVRLLGDRCFEPRAQAAHALGEVAVDGERVLEALRLLYFDPVWKVRAAVLDALARLVERGVVEPTVADEEMRRILNTSNGYVTEYPLKAAYNRLRRVVTERREGR